MDKQQRARKGKKGKHRSLYINIQKLYSRTKLTWQAQGCDPHPHCLHCTHGRRPPSSRNCPFCRWRSCGRWLLPWSCWEQWFSTHSTCSGGTAAGSQETWMILCLTSVSVIHILQYSFSLAATFLPTEVLYRFYIIHLNVCLYTIFMFVAWKRS